MKMQVLCGLCKNWFPPYSTHVDVNFLTLSKDIMEELNRRVRNSNTLLNGSQCGDLSSKLVETIENVMALISNCGESSIPFTPVLRNIYKISEKAKRLVSNCSNEKLREASLIFQLQNDKAFQEILLDLGLCYNVICEQTKAMRGERDPQIKDLRESSTFSPASEEKVREDQDRLQKRLKRLAKCSSNSWEKCLANYLLRKLDSSPQHGQAKELDISTSPILWVKETEPPGTWKYDGFLGGGSGASGVCSTQWLGIPCAKKEFHTEVEMVTFVREVGILSRLNHPNVVNFFCCRNGPEKGQCFIGMELMQMSLFNLIQDQAKKGGKPFPLLVAIDIIVQIARGMCYLHDCGIAHRDLKPSNVVVSRLITPHLDDNFCVKLVDFGMSKTKVEVSKSNTISIPGVGTTTYRAPEVHPMAQNFTQGNNEHAKVVWSKADVYSFGVTCAEILSLKPPFEGVKSHELYEELVKGRRPELPSHCPGKLVSLLKDCWNGAPCSRPTFRVICTRLEVVKYDLLRDSTSIVHGGPQEVGIDPMGYNYIEEVMLRNQKFASITNLLNGLSPLDTVQEEADNLQFAGLDQEERREKELKAILVDMEPEVTKSKMLVGSGRGTPLLATCHTEVGPSMREYEQTMATTPGPQDILLQIPYMLIADPKKCQTTTIPLPDGVEGGMLHYIHQGDSLLLWNKEYRRTTSYMLKDCTDGTATPRSSWLSWLIVCEGVTTPDVCHDCKDGKDGMRIVEATPKTILIYDVINSKVEPDNFKARSPLPIIKHYDEDEIIGIVLHPNFNIIFWVTTCGVVGAYNLENEELIGRVHLPQPFVGAGKGGACVGYFSITLNMLVVSTIHFDKKNIFTWTLNDEQVKRMNEIEDHYLCDLHNDQVQLLVHDTNNLAIYDLQQRKELHKWTPKDNNARRIFGAKFSCDSQLVYALFFLDDSVGIFDATCLQLRCRITRSAYTGFNKYVSIWHIAVHPQKRNQFAMLSRFDKCIYVIEPSHELGGEWVCKAN